MENYSAEQTAVLMAVWSESTVVANSAAWTAGCSVGLSVYFVVVMSVERTAEC